MARYVRSKLSLDGDPEILPEIVEKMKSDTEAISFQNIIPAEPDQIKEELWGVEEDAEETDEVIWRNGTILEFSFATIMKAPLPIYEKIAHMYPQLHMKVEYAFEDYGENCGIYESAAGSSELHFIEPEDPLVFACDVWGVDPEEQLNELAINFYEE